MKGRVKRNTVVLNDREAAFLVRTALVNKAVEDVEVTDLGEGAFRVDVIYRGQPKHEE